MFDFTRNELNNIGIDLVSCISLNECEISKPHLLKRCDIEEGSAIIFALPYLTPGALQERNVSSYAVSRDYHIFFKELFEDIILKLQKRYPDYKFAGFSDHSPINEIKAAAKAGLGVIGKNHLLITNNHSSYVFIGEIITDAILPSKADTINYCINCGKCIEQCPVDGDISKCLSALTQKKGELSDDEIKAIKSHKTAWGCDKCQEVCPYTKKALECGSIFTKIEFFNDSITPTLTSNDIDKMDENTFKERAYSWRGKSVISRNLKILEEDK